jgi:hypothetical protein
MFISHQGKKPFAVDMALARGSSVSESHFQISCTSLVVLYFKFYTNVV